MHRRRNIHGPIFTNSRNTLRFLEQFQQLLHSISTPEWEARSTEACTPMHRSSTWSAVSHVWSRSMASQSVIRAREQHQAVRLRACQVRHAAGHWLSDENVPLANKGRARGFSSASTRAPCFLETPGVKRPCRPCPVCLVSCLRASLSPASARQPALSVSPVNGHADYASAWSPVRPPSTQETVHYGRTHVAAAWTDEPNRGNLCLRGAFVCERC